MPPAHSCPFKVLWITLQLVILALIVPYPGSTLTHYHPYVSEFRYIPQYHPSRNPDCRRMSRWDGPEFHEGRSSTLEAPLVDEQSRPWIEIRAVLARCSKTRKGGGEMSRRQPARKCGRKVIISMRINNVGKTNTREEFVLVDHVLDPIQRHRVRLRNPLVVKIRQEPLLHLYGLRFQGVVNAEAKEEVINNRRANFTGCNDDASDPTCGQMLIDGEPIPFSQGFCCSCGSSRVDDAARRAGSFHSAAKSNYRRDRANTVRNRSAESTADLFDGPKAPRQVERGKGEESANGDALRVTSRDISAVNGPLGEQTSPWKRPGEESRGENSAIRRSGRTSAAGFPRAGNAGTLSPVPRSAFFDPTRTRSKIEAYIDAVYERAMRERTVAVQEGLSRILDRRTNDGRGAIHGSVADDSRNPIARLTRPDGDRLVFRAATSGNEKSRESLGTEKRDGSANVSGSGDRGGNARYRSGGATRSGNTFDYTPTSPATRSSRAASRIPEKSQFSRQTERNALSDASPDNGSFATAVELFASSGTPLSRIPDRGVNSDVAPPTIKSNDFAEDARALLSKLVISVARSPTEDEERRYGFGTSGKTSGKTSGNASREASSAGDGKLSAVAIRNDYARSGRSKGGNANVSTRIPAAPAFTGLRSLSFTVGISKPGESPMPAVARPGDKSSTKIHESGTRGSLMANEIQERRAGNSANLYEYRDSRGIYNPPERMSKDVNLKKSHKFWKPRRKSRKPKGARGGSRSFEKSSRESRRKRASSGFEFGSPLRDERPRKRSQRHSRCDKDDLNSAVAESEKPDSRNEDSRRRTQVFIDRALPEMAYSKTKMPGNTGNGSPKKQVILETGHLRRKVRPEGGDNVFFGNDGGKESNVDKRIEDKFVRISNVLREDSTEDGGIQRAPKDHAAVTKSEVANAEIPEIRDGRTDDLFPRRNDKPDDRPATIRDGEMAREYTAGGAIGTRQRTAMNESIRPSADIAMTANEVTGISAAITRQDDFVIDHEGSAFLRAEGEHSTAVIDSPLSSPTARKPVLYISRELNPDESTDPIYANDFAVKRTDLFTREPSSMTPRDREVVDYLEVAHGPAGTSSGSWSGFKEATMLPGAPDDRSENERERAGMDASLLELNNSSSRIISGCSSAGPRGPLIEPGLSLRGCGDEADDRSRYSAGPFLGNSESIPGNGGEESSGRSQRSRARNEIAELVDRVVRQYAGYTPIMPGMPTFDEITEAETLPSEETTGIQFTVTLETTTRITDEIFRPSLRPLRYPTTSFSYKMHDEVSLDETTFVDETEATTGQESTVSKSSFQTRRLDASPGSEETARRVPSEIGTGGKQRQGATGRITASSTRTTDAEEEAGDHPWYRETQTQQIIGTADRSEKIQRAEAGKERRRYRSKVESSRDTGWSSSTTFSLGRVANGIVPAQTRSKRSGFIRESDDRDSSIFYDHGGTKGGGENRQNGRAALNRNVESPTRPIGLRSEIEERLAGGSDYPANRGSHRNTHESQERAQKRDVASQDITERKAGLRSTNDNDSPKSSALLELCRANDDSRIGKFDEDVSWRSRAAILTSIGTPSPGPAKLVPVSRGDLAESARQTERRADGAERRVFGERVTEIDGLAVTRVMNPSGNVRTASTSANDLSIDATVSRRQPTGGILPDRARNAGDQDKSRAADTVVRGARLMTASDNGGTMRDRADHGGAARRLDKNDVVPTSSNDVAKRRGREDASKINEDPSADVRARRVPAGEKYLRRPLGKVYDTVRGIIGKIKKGRRPWSDVSDGAGIERSIGESEEGASRRRREESSPADRRRSGRRLLSREKSSYVGEIEDDEYYEDDDESETDERNDSASENMLIRRSDDLSGLVERPDPRTARDRRKLVAAASRSVDENVDAGGIMAPKVAMVSDDAQAVSEEAISRKYEEDVTNKDVDSEEESLNIDSIDESIDAASNNKVSQALFAKEKVSIIKNTVNNDPSLMKQGSYGDEKASRSSQIYEEIDERPLSPGVKINDDDLRDEFLRVTQPTAAIFDTVVNPSAVHNRPINGETLDSVDLSRGSARPGNGGGVKISLSGRIRVNGGFNQTPVLISFDAVPVESTGTLLVDDSSVSVGLTSAIATAESTAINLPLDGPNAEFDPPFLAERANDEAYDSLNTSSSDGREHGETNARVGATKPGAKFFDLARRNEKERRSAGGPDRIERRLDKDNANSGTAKRVFLTDYSSSGSERDGTSAVGRTISQRIDEAIDKLDPRSAATSPVYFPEILGSVLVNNGRPVGRDAITGSRCRIGVSANVPNRSDSTADRSTTMSPRVVPLVRVGIEKPRVDDPDEGNATRGECRPGVDSPNTTSGGCYETAATAEPGTFQSGARETSAKDRSAEIASSSLFAKPQGDVSETAIGCSTSETPSRETPCSSDKSVNGIRARNMMAVVRFMMRLLRIVTEDEEPPCPTAQIGETMVQGKNLVVDDASRGNTSDFREYDTGKQKLPADKTTVDKAGDKTRQNFTTIEWRSTITERNRGKRSSLEDSPFTESFTEAPSRSTASTLSGEALKDNGPSTLFETSTVREVYAPSTSSATTLSSTRKSFLFYEDTPRGSTSVVLTDVRKNSSVPFNDSTVNSAGEGSRLDGSQTTTNRRSPSSWPRIQDRASTVDRVRAGKQETASTNFKRDNGGIEPRSLLEEEYPTAATGSADLRRSKSTGVVRDTIRPMLSRDTGVSRDSLLGGLGAARVDKRARKSKETVSERRVAGMELLNSAARGGSPGDRIGERRAAARPPVDRKLEESREAPSGTATSGKIVFRRARGKIDRPGDHSNLGSGGKDSFKIEGRAVDGGLVATDDASSAISVDLDPSGGADSSARADAICDSTASSPGSDAALRSSSPSERIDEEIANERVRFCDLTISRRAPNKKRDVGERRDFRTDKRVFKKKRQKAPSPTREKKRRRKWKTRRGNQRTRDSSEIRNRRFRRRLLMASLEPGPTYDADDADDGDDAAARRPGRYKRQSAEDFPRVAGGNAARREDGGTRTVDGPEADPGRAQIRGGQDCTDRGHPANIDAAKYLESAHCLRFSDLWYSVYQLEYPIVEHAVYLQVYEKRVLANGSAQWEDLTGDSIVRLGTFNRRHRSGEDTIAFAYKEVKMPGRGKLPNLDVAHDRLLVPSSVTSKGSEYPVEGGSDEYLVVPASSINENGNECDKAGVGFAAFAGQTDRCGRVRGTCLKNQPLAYRRHDAEARAAGRPGCYFLSNFASVPSGAIKYSANGSGSREFLALEYHSPHVSAIDIGIRASYNAALVGGPVGSISEVRVDSTALDNTVITVVITNRGSTAASYRSRIADCPAGLPESWVNATFPKSLVQPRRDRTASLSLYGELPINEFYCSVQLLNRLGERAATRRIKIRKADRCCCVLHCLCACVADARDTRHGCRPMSPELYHAAGFRGPVPTIPTERGIFSDTTVDVLLFVVSLTLLLLLMGFLKWSIGLYVPAVGRWGLDSLLKTGSMSEYWERELMCKRVVTDERGAPVHPDTRRRTVRICSRKTEFFLNAIFFLIFPFAVCCYRLKRSSLPTVRRARCANESKISLTSDKSERPRTICVSTYGDSRDSRMEAEDTRYVMDELKKSEEPLRGHNGSRRSRCAKGYRSRH